ncbi:glycosyltransferase [Lysobacter sp. GX 14042]|uniref:CgeB family protein n=1 Tax=Lysobacter sp. GX 14042 TaxID=2907155 RepID=UPI001F386C25|nr:glycosyltransferase [Lysobacter sp. GX 14042]MCE7031716.1 glycosyltransferase [Lysobacter sp. GX 14042]
MKFVLFYHSLVSDWNHGNAHFLRGVVAELLARGHEVQVHEPADGWSRAQMVAGHGQAAVEEFHRRFPALRSHAYPPQGPDLDQALDGADVVLVHEWNEPELVARIGRQAPGGCRLLFHDTHHRAASAPGEMARYQLRDYDGVLAFGEAVRQRYLEHGWAAQAWTWHEAADTRVFRPIDGEADEGDLVWIGNWGDEERSRELREFLVDPVRRLGLRARIHGVRYPDAALRALEQAGIEYRGWLPNHRAPEVFARFRATVHVPRRPYVETLPGIPTIRMFEALACGIPLASAWWPDDERLFTPGRDYLVARDGKEMERHLHTLVHDREAAGELAAHGLATVLARHTCAHRVDELMEILCGPLARDTHEPRSLTHA